MADCTHEEKTESKGYDIHGNVRSIVIRCKECLRLIDFTRYDADRNENNWEVR